MIEQKIEKGKCALDVGIARGRGVARPPLATRRRGNEKRPWQKNWSVVRQLIGYDRDEGLEAVAQFNRLYALLYPYLTGYLPTMKLIGKERAPLVHNDAFNAPSQFVTDQQLGKKTHWEGSLNLSDPTSSLVWTCVADAAPASVSGDVSGMQPATGSHSGPQIRSHISSRTCGNGGIKLYQNLNFSGGDCIAFYGSGSQDLHILYPGCVGIWR